ncbi:hypothetical protein LP417_33950 (plasmid) [Polaromonas sp. P1-6]|nr:hypothetical protein LP417_33950 [Polaromonas sp. P1-6]
MNLKIRTPDQATEKAAQSELLPWLCHVAPDWVLCKDGSLIAGFEYSGLDIDNADQYNTEQVLRELQTALAALDERYYLWWTVDKRRETHYREGEFASDAARNIDDSIVAQYKRGRSSAWSTGCTWCTRARLACSPTWTTCGEWSMRKTDHYQRPCC